LTSSKRRCVPSRVDNAVGPNSAKKLIAIKFAALAPTVRSLPTGISLSCSDGEKEKWSAVGVCAVIWRKINGLERTEGSRSAGWHGDQYVRLRSTQVSGFATTLPGSGTSTHLGPGAGLRLSSVRAHFRFTPDKQTISASTLSANENARALSIMVRRAARPFIG
jgi:hypothetical protein